MPDTKAYDMDDPNAPKFCDDYTVLDQIVLNFTDIGHNNNKFYVMELQQCDQDYRIFTHYGRVGTPGAKESRYFLKDDLEQEEGKTIEDIAKEKAEKEFQRILKAKQKKGYVPVDMHHSDVGSGKVQPKSKTQAKKAKQNLDARIQQFVEQIYSEASQSLASTIKTPLGALSAAQIYRGYEKLEEIRTAISSGDKRGLASLTSQYYSLIPQRFQGRIDLRSALIDTASKTDRQEELLQLMRDVLNVKDDLDSEIAQKYRAINATIQALEQHDSEYQRVAEFIEETQSPHHPFRIMINNIFAVEIASAKGSFNPKKLSTRELFHGSANKNILGILQRGLLIAPPGVQYNGSAFGRGIYFARHSTKSAQYAIGFNNYSQKNGFFFVADAALGRMQVTKYYSWGGTGLQPGYDSVMGVAGADLLHDEFIVYNTNQTQLRYVIDFTPKTKR